ncbi:MAG: cobalt-precorrin-3B C(17)-methyltransferase, partial [Thermoprotei archaeon]
MATRGKLFVVGIGPGALEHMTLKALDVLRRAEVIVAYTGYLKILNKLGLTRGKKVLATGMGEEVKRVQLATEEVLKGHDVALVCSGDPGIYGLAELVFRYLDGMSLSIDVEIVPGITAAIAAASILGAPLNNDFVILSLSDYFTPWNEILEELRAVAKTELVIVLYNPSSSRRHDKFSEALKLLAEARGDPIICVVKNAYR